METEEFRRQLLAELEENIEAQRQKRYLLNLVSEAKYASVKRDVR